MGESQGSNVLFNSYIFFYLKLLEVVKGKNLLISAL